MSTAPNVTAAKPKTGGSLYWAPVGTALPTDSSTALNQAFTHLGYISEDGVTNSNSPESDAIKAWGGDTVLPLFTGREDTFQFTLLEALLVDVRKLVYGESNVTGTLAAGITSKASATDLGDHSFVFEMILRNGAAHRVVIPIAKVTEVGDITYSDSAAVGYQITLTASADSTGYTHYEYTKAAAQG